MSMQFKKGFSLTEVLMAAGILVIGFMMIAMIYPVGIKLAASATERTIGVVVAEEAVAKLKIYAGHPDTIDFGKFRTIPDNEVMLFEDVVDEDFTGDGFGFILKAKENTLQAKVPPVDYKWHDEMVYPSLDYYDNDIDTDESKYHWTAMCGDTGNGNDVEVLILVTRKTTTNNVFPVPDPDTLPANTNYGYTNSFNGQWPKPVRAKLIKIDQWNWRIDTAITPINFINKGSIVIDVVYDPTEEIRFYHVIDKIKGNEIEMDGQLQPAADVDDTVAVWVVPPAERSSRSPLVGVYPAGTMTFQ